MVDPITKDTQIVRLERESFVERIRPRGRGGQLFVFRDSVDL